MGWDAGMGVILPLVGYCIVLHLWQVADCLENLSDVNREQVEKAGKDISDAAVKLLSNSLRLPGKEVSPQEYFV